MMGKCMRVAAVYRAQIRVDSLSLNDCADQLSLQGATSTLCHRVVRDVFWHELRPSASLPLQADSHSRSSFVPSRVTRSQLSSAARERHVSIVGASERASKRANERTSASYPFENYCLQISAYCAPWDGQEFRQRSSISPLLAPGLEGRSR